jgi:hypothetical protein
MDHEAHIAEPAMPCCCARCGAAFDLRTQQQLKMLMRLADLGMGLAEAVAAFPLRTGHVDGDVTQNFELLGRGVRRCLALEAKLTEDARRRHAREAHGAPPAREPGERPARPLPPVTAEDQESVVGPEAAAREPGENLLGDTREKLLDRFVEDHSAAVVVASVCRDFGVEEDIGVFMEPVPTRDDPWVRAETEAVVSSPSPSPSPRPSPASGRGGVVPPAVAKGRGPP